MAWNPPCKIKFTKVKDNSLKSTQNYLVAHKATDKLFNIIDLPKFRDIRDWLQEKASKKGYFSDLLIQDEQNGKKAIFNIPGFKKLDGINAQTEKIIKREGKQGNLFKSIDYKLRGLNILQSPKADEIFRKGDKFGWSIEKMLQELQVPLIQQELIKSFNTRNREQIITSLLANYSYTIEINTTTGTSYFIFEGGQEWTVRDSDYDIGHFKTKEEAEVYLKSIDKTPSQHYSNLTVPGGINYRENEIATPGITPSIKGHAQFATDKGIGWFRSDDKDNLQNKDSFISGKYLYSQNMGWQYKNEANKIHSVNEEDVPKEIKEKLNKKDSITKTRRILEVQSDLFQKGRDKENLSKTQIDNDDRPSSQEEADRLSRNQETSNSFLQLLNKDNNWVTFFVKSIIQDSAKKGYEKVLFPSGNTASKVEGHTTLEEFKKQKEDRIKQIEGMKNTLFEKHDKEDKWDKPYKVLRDNQVQSSYPTKELALEEINKLNGFADNEINQLKQELERVEKEGFSALKPIYNFYENQVKNILKKNYKVKEVTDEYGNTWNEVELSSKDLQNILLSKTLPTESNEQFEEFFENELPKEALKEIPKINKPEVVSKLIDIMKQLGIAITQAEIEDDTAALADITNKLIKYSRGKLSEDNFTEEVFHFIVEVLEQKNPELFNIFMDKVRGFQVYQDILNPENGYVTDTNYQNASGRPDLYKLKKEAIAKLLTQKILGNSEENQQKESIFHRLWTLLSDFINSLFGSLPPEKQDEFEEFIDTILNTDYITTEDQQFLEGRTGEFAAKKRDIFKETRYKLGSLAKRRTKFKTNQEQRNHFEAQRDLFTKQEDPDTKETFYIYNGKKKRRVTTLVKAAISKLTGNFDQSEEKRLLREAKMQKGTEVHKELENILYRYIDQNTGLLKETPDQAPSTKLVSDEIYNQLDSHIQERLSLYPEGTRFSMELPIVNEEEGYAGTADFVAFLPNNDVDILDWKTTGINYVMNNQLIERTDISPFNQKYWRKQLDLLKNAMKSQGSKNFRLTRAIPIITDIKEELINRKAKRAPDNVFFYVSSIEIGDVDVSKITRSVLVPVSSESETTGIKELDDIITKLWAQYAKLEKTIYPETEKYKKTIELNKLLKTIRDLQTKKTADSIKDVFDEQFRRIVRLENESFPFLDEIQTNQRFLTDEQLAQINSYIQEVLEARGFLSIFDNFLPLVTSFYPEKSQRTSQQEAILEEVVRTEGNKKKILFDLDKKVLSIYSKLGRVYNIEDINAPDNPRVGGSFLKRFLTLSERPENIIKFAAGVINTLQSQEEENKKEFQEKFAEVQKSFLEYAKNNEGTSEKNIKKLYKKIIKEIAILDKEEKPTGRFNKILISKVDDNEKTGYYSTLAEKATEMADWWEQRENQLKINGLTGEFLQIQLEGEYAELIEPWLKENINLEEYQKIFEEKEADMKEFLSNVKFDEDPFVNQDKKDSYLYSWYNNHNILNSPLSLNTDLNWMLRNSDLASKKWESKEWKELNKPENKPLLDLYKLFEEVNNTANEEGMLDDVFASKRFIAKIKGDASWFTDFLSWSNLNLKYLYLSFGNKLKSLFEADGKDEYFQQKDAITGYRLRSVPVFYKYNTEEVLSDDLFYILNRWATHVHEFKAINKYENLVLGTELVEQLKGEQLNIGSKGNISRDIPTTKKEIDTLGDLRIFNDYYLYSKKYNEKEWYHKLGDLLHTYTALKYLGIHISAISSAYLGGRWSAKLLSTTNFSKEDYTEAETLMTFGTLANKAVSIEKVDAYLNLLREVNPNIHDINENKDESKARMFNKRKFKNIALGGYSFVDNIIQNTMAVVFFKNTTVIDGKFVNIPKYVNSKYQDLYDKSISEQVDIQIKIDKEIKELKETKSLLQLAKFEKGKLKIEGIDLNSLQGKSQMLQYKNLIRGYIKDAIGNASEKDISLARLNWWMKFVLQFKNWMPRVIGSRVSGLKYNTEKQEYTWGRTNLGWSAFWKLGVQTKLAHTFTALVPFISDIKESKLLKKTRLSTDFSIPLQSLAKEVYQNQILLSEKNNIDFDLSEKEFIDLYIKTYKSSIQELNGVMTMAAIVALAALAAGGADDDDKWKWKVFLKMVAGYQREQKTLLDPDSILFITNTLIPVLGSLKDIIHFLEELVGKPVTYLVSESDFLPDAWVEAAQEDLKQSHTLDKGIKTVPFLREGHFWMSVVNPEINGEEYNDIMNIKTPQIK